MSIVKQNTSFTYAQIQEGLTFLINKPFTWTSFDVVKKLKHAIYLKKLKIGHAGTLDPLATGLLLVCTGKLTKSIDLLQAEEKEYTGSFYLGATTESYDKEREVNETFDISGITESEIHEATKEFLGWIDQYPPAHSAIRMGGERVYEKARRGEIVEMKSRKIEIKEFEITGIHLPEVNFRVVCSKGTYIRSLANDFGKALNSGAYLSKLVRTKNGNFDLSEAWELDALIEYIHQIKNENL